MAGTKRKRVIGIKNVIQITVFPGQFVATCRAEGGNAEI